MTSELPVDDPLRVLMRKKLTIGIFALVGAVFATVYYFVAPEVYESTLAVVPIQPSRSAAPSMSGMGAAVLGDLGIMGSSTTGSRIAAVLQSRSVTDSVIKKLSLEQRFGVAHIEQAREHFWASCATSVDRKSDIVTVTCRDKNPELVRDMLQEIATFGNETFRRVSTSTASEERQFLEKQVVEAKQKVDAASSDLQQFQEKNHIVDLSEQAKSVVSAIATLEGERISKDLDLTYVRGFASAQEAGASQLQRQLAILESKLSELTTTEAKNATSPTAQAPQQGSAATRDFFPVASEVPKLRFELEHLLREQKIREAIYLVLTQRLEMTKADEVREASAFQVLDEPTLPTFRVAPRRRVIGIGFVVGSILGLVMVLLPAWWRGLRKRMGLSQSPEATS